MWVLCNAVLGSWCSAFSRLCQECVCMCVCGVEYKESLGVAEKQKKREARFQVPHVSPQKHTGYFLTASSQHLSCSFQHAKYLHRLWFPLSWSWVHSIALSVSVSLSVKTLQLESGAVNASLTPSTSLSRSLQLDEMTWTLWWIIPPSTFLYCYPGRCFQNVAGTLQR